MWVLLSRPNLNILIFLPIFDWKYSCEYSYSVWLFFFEYNRYLRDDVSSLQEVWCDVLQKSSYSSLLTPRDTHEIIYRLQSNSLDAVSLFQTNYVVRWYAQREEIFFCLAPWLLRITWCSLIFFPTCLSSRGKLTVVFVFHRTVSVAAVYQVKIKHDKNKFGAVFRRILHDKNGGKLTSLLCPPGCECASCNTKTSWRHTKNILTRCILYHVIDVKQTRGSERGKEIRVCRGLLGRVILASNKQLVQVLFLLFSWLVLNRKILYSLIVVY